MNKLVIRLSLAAKAHWEKIQAYSRGDMDRGDISITTIIIWTAAVAGALAIAGTIAVVVVKYQVKLSGI
ncbi:hypothetical protein SLAV_39175 [Streptomyces lavendulae subsp. lavendulae]|uniref:Uncharacterized protein n=1 Tax=Streptomyces lavendulae subsp. lavendulae TaxID=58340 RepID=A0A2K8PT02_STRLA|nr:hypothetical protein [Streptomyces lavendulae]ATZ21973.1 hypothetical protein SLAV_00215 [Streptomyces lavendulae subsp. lavendulae]ATZ29598.1 hypothetical protein SLAV_39175 [Streptomyces lavendulae subsp. lavendulae]